MSYYIRDISKLTNLDFKGTVDEVLKVDSKFKVNGGPNTEVDFEVFKAVCQNNSLEVDDDGHIRRYINTDPDTNIKFAPHVVAKPEPVKVSYNDSTLDEFNNLKADKVDPLKVKAELAQVPSNADVAMEVIKLLKAEKTILSDSLVHDITYMRALFQEHPFIIMPIQLGRRIRTQLEPLFVKAYLTDRFNNKIITFNKKSVLYSYIINV